VGSAPAAGGASGGGAIAGSAIGSGTANTGCIVVMLMGQGCTFVSGSNNTLRVAFLCALLPNTPLSWAVRSRRTITSAGGFIGAAGTAIMTVGAPHAVLPAHLHLTQRRCQ